MRLVTFQVVLETTDELVVNDGKDLPDGGCCGNRDVVMVEDLAAVELDQSYAAPIETLKPRRGRLTGAWKSVKLAALRLCCVR